MADSSEIDNALIAKLIGDSTLAALMSDGVYWDVAKAGKTRFVLVSLADPRDVLTFNRRSLEDHLYIVKAVGLLSVVTVPQMKDAGARIDALLDGGTLTATGYTFAAMFRDPDIPRIRTKEVDAVNSAVEWEHRGGYYRVVMST